MKASLRLIAGLFVLVLLGSRMVVHAETREAAAKGCIDCGNCRVCD